MSDALSKKQSSYAKLKDENRRLLSDIRTLVMNGSSLEGMVCNNQWRLRFEQSDIVWSGTPNKHQDE